MKSRVYRYNAWLAHSLRKYAKRTNRADESVHNKKICYKLQNRNMWHNFINMLFISQVWYF